MSHGKGRRSSFSSLSGRSDVVDTLTDIFGAYAQNSPQDNSDSSDFGEQQPRSRKSTRHANKSGVRHTDTTLSLRSDIKSHEVSRLTDLWRQAKSEIKQKELELAKLRKQLEQGESTRRRSDKFMLDMRELTERNTELSDKVRFLEIQLHEFKSDNTRVRTSYQESLTKLSESLKVLEEKAIQNQELMEERDTLRQQLIDLQQEKDTILNRGLENLRAYQEDSLEHERQLNIHKDALEKTEEQVRQMRGQLEQAAERIANLDLESQRYREQAEIANHDLDKAIEEKQHAVASAQNVDALRTQIRHLEVDNARLVRLLATTKEYRRFAETSFVPGVSGSTISESKRSSYMGYTPSYSRGGTHEPFFGGPPLSASHSRKLPDPDLYAGDMAQWREIEPYEQHYGIDDSQPIEPNREQDLWVPTDALKLTIKFRRKHLAHVPTQILREFLKKLNGIWRRRYLHNVESLKDSYEREIEKLKRKLEQRAPYREVLQASTISRLHGQVDALRKASGSKLGLLLQKAYGDMTSTTSRRTKRNDSKSRKSMKKSSILMGSKTISRSPNKRNTGLHESDLWSSTVAFNFPAAADGGGGHSSGWTREKEASRILEISLATVENLSRQISEVSEENKELQAALDRQGATMVTTEQSETQAREAYLAAIMWLGEQWMQATNVLYERTQTICAALRTDILNVYSGKQSDQNTVSTNISHDAIQLRHTNHVGAMEREVTQFYDRARRLFADGISTGQHQDLYRAAKSETQLATVEKRLQELGGKSIQAYLPSNRSTVSHSSNKQISNDSSSQYRMKDSMNTFQPDESHTAHEQSMKTQSDINTNNSSSRNVSNQLPQYSSSFGNRSFNNTSNVNSGSKFSTINTLTRSARPPATVSLHTNKTNTNSLPSQTAPVPSNVASVLEDFYSSVATTTAAAEHDRSLRASELGGRNDSNAMHEPTIAKPAASSMAGW